MAITISGTNGIVGAGFTVDNSGVSVTAGVGTFSDIRGTHHGDGANLTSLPAAQLTGTLPALSAANLTSIPAANLTGALPAISGASLTGISAGKVLQVVPVNFNTSATTTSGSYQDTGLSASITLSANNHVLVKAHGGAANNSAGYGSYYTIYRGSDNIAPHGTEMGVHYGEDNSNNIATTVYMEVRDTPGTGTHTYTVYHKVWGGGTSVFGKNTTGAMILMEIEA